MPNTQRRAITMLLIAALLLIVISGVIALQRLPTLLDDHSAVLDVSSAATPSPSTATASPQPTERQLSSGVQQIPTLSPTLLPDVFPIDTNRIYEIRPEDRMGGGVNLLEQRFSASVWRTNVVYSEVGEAYAVYLVTPRDRCALIMTSVGPAFDQLPKHEREWPCPKDVGSIWITAVDAQTGVVTFVNNAPYDEDPSIATITGTFDPQTEVWQLGE